MVTMSHLGKFSLRQVPKGVFQSGFEGYIYSGGSDVSLHPAVSVWL